MKKYNIALIPGDGIGPEIINEGIKVLNATAQVCNFGLNYTEYPFGAEHYLETKEILPDSFLSEFKDHDAIYFGAVGDPRVTPGILEHELLLKMRFELDQFINLRPCKLYTNVPSPLKSPVGTDIIMVRENIEDLYINKGVVCNGGKSHYSDCINRGSYNCAIDLTADFNLESQYAINLGFSSLIESKRISEYTFGLASNNNRRKVTLISKRNAIPQMYSVWEDGFQSVASRYPDIEAKIVNVDNAAMQLIKNPLDFDVILAPNLFGDILSDLVSGICGGLGFGASGNINPCGVSMFEPLHGSAPKYKGKNTANPIATILAGALLLDNIGEFGAAELIRSSVEKLLTNGSIKTKDMGGTSSTSDVGDTIASEILKHEE